MRLKEIKPGMVIHCKTQEEKKALLEEAERIGYRWSGLEKRPTDKAIISGSTIHFYDKNENCDFMHITWSNYTDGVTEFSDLILPELTAEEAIKLFGELCIGSCQGCPLHRVDDYENCCSFCFDNPEKAVELLAQWKSEHEKKEPEIEWVYRVFGAENYGEKFFQTEEEAIKRCEELAKSQKTKQYARYERVCRVKAVE